MSDYQRIQFDDWLKERMRANPDLKGLAWEAYQAGWEAGVENYQDGEWDYE